MNYKSTLKLVSVFVLSAGIYNQGNASPWLEANDPFLRSDLLLLSDSGTVSAPVNHYPLRWSTFSDDLSKHTKQNVDFEMVNRAAGHILHALHNARYGRGNRAFSAFYANEQIEPGSFADNYRGEWGGFASYEQLEDGFAFRVNTGYSKNSNKTDFNWYNSYISLNAEKVLFTLGKLDRWWGQGWQHNLIMSSSAEPVPELSVSYISSNQLMGNWSLEALIGLPEDAAYERHGAARLVTKPVSLLEFGFTYQSWFDKDGSDAQAAIDGKLTLPKVSAMYHSVYAEVASSAKTSETGAWLFGWSGQFEVMQQTFRIVLEQQKSSNSKQQSQWDNNRYPNFTNSRDRNSYQLDSSYSAAVYVQMSNDHKASVMFKQSDKLKNRSSNALETVKTAQLTYRLPALAGMLQLGTTLTKTETDNELTAWTGYEFRF